MAVPARRESNSNEDDEQRIFKKRQLSKSSSRPTTLSSSIGTADFAKTPQSANGSAMGGGGISFPGDNDVERRDGYVVITPGGMSRSERATWPTLNSDLNVLDYPMTFTGMGMQGGMWVDNASLGGTQFSGGGMGCETSGEVDADGNVKAPSGHELDFFSF